jgi:hypothetical protein
MELDQAPKKIERDIYENAIRRMESLGTKAILQPRLIEKREAIKMSLLDYYESTEEYEKCKYITEYFNELEKEIELMEIIGSVIKKAK